MRIAKATARYEAWLKRHLTIVESDLNFKHEQMRTALGAMDVDALRLERAKETGEQPGCARCTSRSSV